MTRYTVEDRADRMMRRRYGLLDRSTLSWSGIRLSIALRDTERALFAWAGTNVKPDWGAPLRVLYPIALIGVVVYGAVIVAGLLGWFR